MAAPSFIFDFAGTRRVFAGAVEVVRADTLDEVIPALQRVEAFAASGLWCAGYVSYEAAPAFEHAMVVRPGASMPLLLFGVFSSVQDAAAGMPALDGHAEWVAETTPSSFHNAIAQIHEAIAAGETYQVNYTNRLHGLVARDDARALYEQLRAAQGGGLHAYLDIGDYTIVSASPELFFEKRNGQLFTRPMKGTRPRGRWAEEDESYKAELAASPKDRAENLMIVDLLRNDVGRVCETGSVRVPSLFDIERYSTVWQMTSRIEGTLLPDVTVVDIFRALFPCGSVTGAPKINTMKWIARLEGSTREVYCGAIGVVEPGGDCRFSVPIRTVWIDNRTSHATYGVGAGITADSDAAAELEELHAKTSILYATSANFALLETMRCERSVILRRLRHIDRALASADYFGIALSRNAVEAALDAAVESAPSTAKMRMLIASDANVTVEVDEDVPPRFANRSSVVGHVESVALAVRPTNSLDPFMCHKTTNRASYEALRVEGPYFDTLLWNENDEVTEFTFGNVVLELDGVLVTPPRSAGLLAGVFRGELLDTGVVFERPVSRADLHRCTRMWLINSLREWVEVSLTAESGGNATTPGTTPQLP